MLPPPETAGTCRRGAGVPARIEPEAARGDGPVHRRPAEPVVSLSRAPLLHSLPLQMNCWQRRRGTRTSVTSWMQRLLSWQATEGRVTLSVLPLPLSSTITPLLSVCAESITLYRLSCQNKKKALSLIRLSTTATLFWSVCMKQGVLTKTSKEIYMFFFFFFFSNTCL